LCAKYCARHDWAILGRQEYADVSTINMPTKEEERQADEKEQRQLHHRLILFTLICSITGFDYVSHGSNFLEPYARAFANASMSEHAISEYSKPRGGQELMFNRKRLEITKMP